MKTERKIQIISLLILIVISINVVFAWYDNNKEVSASSETSIRVAGSGTLQIAYAHDDKGVLLKPGDANYDQSLVLNLSDTGFDDVTGNGVDLYLPSFEVNGKLADELNWLEITAEDDKSGDNAANEKDSGKYVYLDVYFKSDLPMNIYLNGESSITPKTNSNGTDLVNNNGYEGLILFSNYPDGLPTKNINQSSYGFFSRNMIAGATRVAFDPYELNYDNDTLTAIKAKFPTLVWVPNSTYKLTIPSNSEKLYSMSKGSNSNKEATYSYYSVEEDNEKLLHVIGRDSSDKLMGDLVRDDDASIVPTTIIVNDELLPAKAHIVSDFERKVPAIYVNNSYQDAGKYGDTYYLATYNSTYTDFAYVLNDKLAIYDSDNEQFVEAKLDGDSYVAIEEDPTTWSKEEALALMVKDESTYSIINWIEDDFITSEDGLYHQTETAIAKTEFSYVDTGPYYARVRILIWVEGTDREANISLNGGQFNVELMFVGETVDE